MNIWDVKERNDVCEKHGEFVSKQFLGKIWSKCPRCADDDRIEREERERLREAEEKARQWMRKLDTARIPERFKDRTLESYIAVTDEQVVALSFAEGYADNFDNIFRSGQCAIFNGTVGTGKTHLSIGICIEIMKKGYNPLFTSVQKIMRAIKNSWSQNSEITETEVFNYFKAPDLLVIDEVGVQFGSEFEKNAMFALLNERYENRMPTILLSNLNIEELKVTLGERVFDRLAEDGGKCISFVWESHRRSKG